MHTKQDGTMGCKYRTKLFRGTNRWFVYEKRVNETYIDCDTVDHDSSFSNQLVCEGITPGEVKAMMELMKGLVCAPQMRRDTFPVET